MRPLRNYFVAGLILLAAAPAVRAQDTVIIPCNGTPMGDTYCYMDNAAQTWHWQSECGSQILMQFTSGIIEASLYDQLRIYDGPDETSLLLYVNGPGPGDVDLTGLQFVASSGDLYMEMTSNATNCCATDGFRGAGWEWAWSMNTGSVGIHEEPAGIFTMFPNPAVGEVHLSMPGTANGAAEVRVMDVIGRVVYRNNITAAGADLGTLDLHGLQSGNYSVILTTGNAVMSRKLLVIG